MASRVKVQVSTSGLVGSSDPPYDRSSRRSAISECWNDGGFPPNWRFGSVTVKVG